jgi:hypothetical protein
MRLGSCRPAPNRSLLNSVLNRPTLDSRHQVAPDSSPVESLVNDKTSNLHSRIRL